MTWENVDDLEALRIAIQAEIDTYQYIRSIMAQLSNPDTQKLLAALAREEWKHRKQLEDMYRRLSGHRLLFLKMKRSFLKMEPLNGAQNDVAILEILIQHEQQKMNFYQRAASWTRNARGRAMFQELARQEEKHLEFLRTEQKVRRSLKKHTQRALANAYA